VADGERDNETLKENVKLPSTVFLNWLLFIKIVFMDENSYRFDSNLDSH